MSDPALAALAALSARLGRDPMLVQGGGGNTSIKIADTLWVKASGKWLAAAESEPVFVPVDLGGVRAAIAADLPDPVSGHARPGSALRPSIETSLHALLPHRVVLHLHSVNCLAAVVLRDGEARIAAALEGLSWAWVPYCRPGLDLTRATARLHGGPHDVIVLENHGLVIGAADCAAAQRLVDEVERRFAVPSRPAPPADLAVLGRAAAAGTWTCARDPRLHALATDPANLAHALAGPLFPDQVVFLGPRLSCDPGSTDAAACLVPGCGTLLRQDITDGQEAMLLCLALLLPRLATDAPLMPLPEDEIRAIGGWEAEAYRIALDARRR
jgi:rhamnose utilization protein RhaD (predicted bifunctional aldolase and dehydrogenase)